MSGWWRRVVLTAVCMAWGTVPAGAQERFSFEVTGGGAFATSSPLEAELETGLLFGARVGYRLHPFASAYGAWDWIRFSGRDSLLGPDVDLEETGYAFGVLLEHPLRSAGGTTLYRARLGGTYAHVEVEDTGGTRIADTGHGLGWEAGLSAVVRAGDRLRLTPGFRYRSLSRDVRVDALETPLELRYFLLEMGVQLRL